MLIALLVVLGVDLVIILVLALGVIAHNRWLKKQPGEFAGKIRITSGEMKGIRAKWSRGSGRWVRDVLVWNGAPMRMRNHVIGIDEIATERSLVDGEVKHVGEHPVLAQMVTSSGVIEVVASEADHKRLVGQTAE